MTGYREIIASTRYRCDDLTKPAKHLHILRASEGAYILSADFREVEAGDEFEIAFKYREADAHLRSLGYKRMSSYSMDKGNLFSW